MKKILLLLLIIPTIVSSQWRYEVVNDPFKGTYEYTSATGYGGEYPYNNPSIAIVNQDGDVQILIRGAGYSGCDAPYIDISFGNPKEIISLTGTPDIEKESMFVSSFNSDEDILSFLNGLKNKSLVYIKYGTNCNTNIFQISLKGSSNSIDKVAGNYISELEKNIGDLASKKRRDMDYFNLKKERLTKLTGMIPELRRRVITMGELEDIMRSHWTKNYEFYSNDKNSVDILDIDSISLSPALLDCWKRVTIYDFDLPEDKQEFISFYYEVRIDNCEISTGF